MDLEGDTANENVLVDQIDKQQAELMELVYKDPQEDLPPSQRNIQHPKVHQVVVETQKEQKHDELEWEEIVDRPLTLTKEIIQKNLWKETEDLPLTLTQQILQKRQQIKLEGLPLSQVQHIVDKKKQDVLQQEDIEDLPLSQVQHIVEKTLPVGSAEKRKIADEIILNKIRKKQRVGGGLDTKQSLHALRKLKYQDSSIKKRYKRWKLEKHLQQQELQKSQCQIKQPEKQFKPVKCRFCGEQISSEELKNYSFVREAQLCHAHIDDKLVKVQGNQIKFCIKCSKWLPMSAFGGSRRKTCYHCLANQRYINTNQKLQSMQQLRCFLCNKQASFFSVEQMGFCMLHLQGFLEANDEPLQECISCHRVLPVSKYFTDTHLWCKDCRQNYEIIFRRQGFVKLNTQKLKKLQNQPPTVVEFLDVCEALGVTIYQIELTVDGVRTFYEELTGETLAKDDIRSRFILCIRGDDNNSGPYVLGPFLSKPQLLDTALLTIFNSGNWFKTPVVISRVRRHGLFLKRCQRFQQLLQCFNRDISRTSELVSCKRIWRNRKWVQQRRIVPHRVFRPYFALVCPDNQDLSRNILWGYQFPELQPCTPDAVSAVQYPNTCVGCGSGVEGICIVRKTGFCLNCMLLHNSTDLQSYSRRHQSRYHCLFLRSRNESPTHAIYWYGPQQSLRTDIKDIVELCRIRDVGFIIHAGWENAKETNLDKEEKYSELKYVAQQGNKELFKTYLQLAQAVNYQVEVDPWPQQLTPFLKHTMLYDHAMALLKKDVEAFEGPKGYGVVPMKCSKFTRGGLFRATHFFQYTTYYFKLSTFEQSCKLYDKFKILCRGFNNCYTSLNYPLSTYAEELKDKAGNFSEFKKFCELNVYATKELGKGKPWDTKGTQVVTKLREPWEQALKIEFFREGDMYDGVDLVVAQNLVIARAHILVRNKCELQKVSDDYNLAAGFEKFDQAVECVDRMLMEQYGFKHAQKKTICVAEDYYSLYKSQQPMQISSDIDECIRSQKRKWGEIASLCGAVDHPFVSDFQWKPYNGNTLVQRHGNNKFVILLDQTEYFYGVFEDQNDAFRAKDLIQVVLFGRHGRLYFPAENYRCHPLLDRHDLDDLSFDDQMTKIVYHYGGVVEQIPKLLKCDLRCQIADKVQQIQGFFIINPNKPPKKPSLFGLFNDFESAIKAHDVIQIAKKGDAAKTFYPTQNYLSNPYTAQTIPNKHRLFKIKQEIIYFFGGNCLSELGIWNSRINGHISLPGNVIKNIGYIRPTKKTNKFIVRCHPGPPKWNFYAYLDDYDKALRVLDILNLRRDGFDQITAFPKSDYVGHMIIYKVYESAIKLYEGVSEFFGGYCKRREPFIFQPREGSFMKLCGIRGLSKEELQGGVRNYQRFQQSDDVGEGAGELESDTEDENEQQQGEGEGQQEQQSDSGDDYMFERDQNEETEMQEHSDASASGLEDEQQQQQNSSENEADTERSIAQKRKREEDEEAAAEHQYTKQLTKISKNARDSHSCFKNNLKKKEPNRHFIGVCKRGSRNINYVPLITNYDIQTNKASLPRFGFKTAVEAARSYDRAMILKHGLDNAVINFPKSDYEDLKGVRANFEGPPVRSYVVVQDHVQEYKDEGGDPKKDNIPPWLTRVTPELGELMESIRGLAQTQNLQQERRRILAPEVLLACAVIVEECAKEFSKETGKFIS